MIVIVHFSFTQGLPLSSCPQFQLSLLAYLASLYLLSSAGDLRRANGLLARYGHALQEGGPPSILTFNLLMKVILLM